MDAKNLIWSWLEESLSEDSLKWIQEKAKLLSKDPTDNDTFIAFSGAIRYSGKKPLGLVEGDYNKSQSIQNGWKPVNWTFDDAARIYLLLSLDSSEEKKYAEIIDKLFQNSDMKEGAAIIKASAILPHSTIHYQRVREGARTNMKNVFEAVSHYNPYPSLHFEEDSWNQMVLKSLFIESKLNPIFGLESRNNPTLIKMLVDYSRERRAASRLISPELWRCVGLIAEEKDLNDLEKAFEVKDPLEKKGAALALFNNKTQRAKNILQSDSTLMAYCKSGKLNWDNVFEFEN